MDGCTSLSEDHLSVRRSLYDARMWSARRVMVFLVVVGTLGMVAAPANASAPACPATPADYTPASPAVTTADTDAIVSELRAARQENAATCAVILASTNAASAAIATQGGDIVSAIDAAPGGSTGPATTVKLSTTAPLPDEYVKSYNAMREALWVLIGLVVAQLILPFMARTFRW